MKLKKSTDEKEIIIQNLFNKIVGRYDLMNSLMTLGLDNHWRNLVLDFSGIETGEKCLDICCGTGLLTIKIAKSVGPDGLVVGIDFSEKMLKKAQKRVYANNMQQVIKLIQGNALYLPFNNNSFDCATVAWGLRNIPGTMLAIQEMIRVVKPGSKIISLDMAQPTIPIFKEIYWQYFKIFIPTIAALFSSYKEAYQYLYKSSREFLSQEQLAELFQQAGLKNVNYHNICGGVVAIVEGEK